MARNKEETKARILAAVGRLLAASGFKQLGINAIAREAQVDKVLIYRYFGDLPALLRTFGQEGNYWILPDALIGNDFAAKEDSLADSMAKFMIQGLQDLRERPITQEILRWELLEANELTQELALVREQTAMRCLDFLEQRYSFPLDKNIPAISTILLSAIVYLVLRSKAHRSFLGIDLTSPEGWSQIEQTIASLIQAILKN
jgi:AcrR family transcriptional regulator